MKTHSKNKIEQSLSMYRETVSPPHDLLISVLDQIPEKEANVFTWRVIRSPYRWVAMTQIAVACAILIFVFPYQNNGYENTDFYKIDSSIDDYESGINDEDYKNMLIDYSNL